MPRSGLFPFRASICPQRWPEVGPNHTGLLRGRFSFSEKLRSPAYRGGGPLVVENREGVFSRYPKKESGSWGESDRGGIRLWGKVYNVSAKWKVFLDLIG